MPEQEALWREATVSPRLLAAVQEANSKRNANHGPLPRIPCRITLFSAYELAHQKYCQDVTLKQLLLDIGCHANSRVVIGGCNFSAQDVDQDNTRLMQIWKVFRSTDLFLYIVVDC